MLDVGFGELLLIALVLLVFVGPERIPGLLATLGRWYGQLKRAARDFQRGLAAEAELVESLRAGFWKADGSPPGGAPPSPEAGGGGEPVDGSPPGGPEAPA